MKTASGLVTQCLCLLLWTGLGWAEAAPEFSSPGMAAFLVEDLAHQQGLKPKRIEARWSWEKERVEVSLEAEDFPLPKATPFLMIAAGKTSIDRVEGGRRISFPVAAPSYLPAPGKATVEELQELLDRPFLGEPKAERLEEEGKRPRLLLSAVLPSDLARDLVSRTTDRFGRQSVSAVVLEFLSPDLPRLTLELEALP